MKHALILLTILCVMSGCGAMKKKDGSGGGETATAGVPLRHVVMFKFKADATAEQIGELERAFEELPAKIDTITDFEWGVNVSKEDRSNGFTHCFVVTFADQAGLDTYLPHPAHQAFVSKLRPALEGVMVIDFYPNP